MSDHDRDLTRVKMVEGVRGIPVLKATARLARISTGRRLLEDFIELRSMTISELARAHDMRPSTVLWLMCETMKEDERVERSKSISKSKRRAIAIPTEGV
jgi:hypothetical protein